MTEIRRRLDAIVRGLKEREALAQVRFVGEYSEENAEVPVRGLMAVVGVKQIARERGYLGRLLSSSLRGETYGVDAEICLYAPAEENGSGLTEVVGELLAGLEAADEEHVITSAGASSIEFDPDLNAIFRRVSLHLEFCVCEEEEDDVSV